MMSAVVGCDVPGRSQGSCDVIMCHVMSAMSHKTCLWGLGLSVASHKTAVIFNKTAVICSEMFSGA
jgi:hypothetical protein